MSEFDYPATLYLTTHYCRHRVPVIDLALGYILWKIKRPTIELPEYGIPRAVSITTYDETQRIVRRLIRWFEQSHLDTTAKNEAARRHRTPRQRNLCIEEVQENRRQIRMMTGKDQKHFCYPSGDYDDSFFSWLNECGVESAATCEVGLRRMIPRR